MSERFSLSDVVAGYRWLGHSVGVTELVALHPEYKRGRKHYAWNRERQSWPRTWYGRREEDVVSFVRRFAGERLVCFGLNPRPRLLVNERGFLRGAREGEIEVVQNALFDFDLRGAVSESRVLDFWAFLDGAMPYFWDQGLRGPDLAFTGQGFHALFAFPPMRVAAYPDVRSRLRMFREGFREAFRADLEAFGAVLDHTDDLRRVVKVYGTAKPDVGVLSRFYGEGVRVEDQALREYLLSLSVPVSVGGVSGNGCAPLPLGRVVPSWFDSLLSSDARVRGYWEGVGKAGGDVSRSGYDFSLVQRLLSLGRTDVAELATILVHRPRGAAAEKGEAYVRRTIANALVGGGR